MNSNENRLGLENFYQHSAPNFLNWSPDLKMTGLYAMHIGYQNWQEPVSNSISVLQMSKKIIESSKIYPGQTILDAGCGVGNLAFEIKSIEPKSNVYGIDLTGNHIYLANQYNKDKTLPHPEFSIQDYEYTAFQSEIFDRIIFCESLIHAQNKEGLIQEVYRIIKSKGRITIADIFMHTNTLTNEENEIMEGIKTNMYIPDIFHIKKLVALLSINGFSDIKPKNITNHVIAPADYYSLEQKNPNEEIQPQNMESLLVGLQNLMRTGKAGYYIITAQKK